MRQLASLLVYPLGTAVALMVLGLVLSLISRRRLGFYLALAGFGWLWLWSMPVASDWIRGSLENDFPRLAARDAPRAPVAVVLGGAFSHDRDWPAPDLSGSADRYWHAARLFHAGKVERIILSGGRSRGLGPGLTEAESGAVFLRDLGVPQAAILLETEALTTRENAVNVAAMLEARGVEDFLLVTSALHMRRSIAAFEAVGLQPIPVATDFEVRVRPGFRLRRWLPNAGALVGSTRAFHEYVGFRVYRLRGWV